MGIGFAEGGVGDDRPMLLLPARGRVHMLIAGKKLLGFRCRSHLVVENLERGADRPAHDGLQLSDPRFGVVVNAHEREAFV